MYYCQELPQGGGGVLMRILVGGVLPGSPIPDPISDQKCHFPHPFSDLEEVAKPTYLFTETEIIASLPRLERQLKIS